MTPHHQMCRVRTSVLVAITLVLAAGDMASAQDWPSWRGPNDDGVTGGDAPVTWSDEEHVKWKVPIVGRGLSSPVVWGNQVFVTTAARIDASGAVVPEPAGNRPGFPGGGRGWWGPRGDDADDADRERRREEWRRRREEWQRQGNNTDPGQARGGDDPEREQRREEWRRRREEWRQRAGDGADWDEFREEWRRLHGDDGASGWGGGWWGRRRDEQQVAHRFLLLSIDKRTGTVQWQRTATEATPHEGFFPFYGSFASNSPVTDGEHVFAYFGSRGLYCYDLAGNLIWSKDLGDMNKVVQFGEGTPVVLHKDRVFVKWDHEGESFIVALDKETGHELWRADREQRTSWSPPIVVDHEGQKQVVVAGSRRVHSYDYETGDVIWEIAGIGRSQIPAPVRDGARVYVMGGLLMAIQLGNRGDLTDTDAVAWSERRAISHTVSPALFDNQLYVLNDRGILTNFDATTGELNYRQRLPGPSRFISSPVGANGKLYLSTENGRVFVLKMGPTYELLATNTLKDAVFMATPAIADGEIFLRSHDTLYCISGAN